MNEMKPTGASPVDLSLGPLPEPATMGTFPGPHGYSKEQMRTYAAQEVAAERERCAKLCEEVHADTSECPELALHCAARIRGAQRPSSGARRRRVACSAVLGSTDHCLMTTKGTDVYNLKTTPGPWRWWTSCSFRRLSSEATGRDGDVLHAATQHSDGHPDVQLMNGGHDGPDGRAIAAVPDMLKVLQMIDAHYSGSLDHQPGYVKAARQVLGGICAA